MKSLRRSWAAGLVLAVAGCGLATHAPVLEQEASPANMSPTGSNTAVAASNFPDLTTSGGSAATGGASLPFATVAFDDEGQGNTFKAGPSETVVLRSKADLDAFVARHAPAIAPVGGPNLTIPSPGPRPVPYDPSSYQPKPIADTLEKLDFGKFEAIAFFDGNVKVASMARITAVQDTGSQLVVASTQWDPPPNPDAVPDVNGRLHVVALAINSEPVVAGALLVTDDASASGGGYSIGGNPPMSPQWKAVPNPAITREVMEKSIGPLGMPDEDAADFNAHVLTYEPLSNVLVKGGPLPSLHFTPDSWVWVVTYNVNLPGDPTPVPSPNGGHLSVVPPPQPQQITEIYSPEDGQSCGGWGRLLSSISSAPSATP